VNNLPYLAVVWARRGCGVRNRRGPVEEHGNSAVELQGQQCRARPTPIRCDRYYLLACAMYVSTCHLSPLTTRTALRLFRPPARPLYWWKLNKHARCLCPWAVQSVQAKHSRSCYDRSRATVAQRISTCFLVSKGHCTYKDLSCPYMRHHSTVPTYVLLHGAQDPLLEENIMRLVKLSIVELLGWWISRLISRLMLFYCGRKILYHDW
jgi:hypothetical protein